MHRRSECKSLACRATAPPITSFDLADIPKSALEEARRRGEEVTHAACCSYCKAVWSKGGILLGERVAGTKTIAWLSRPSSGRSG